MPSLALTRRRVSPASFTSTIKSSGRNTNTAAVAATTTSTGATGRIDVEANKTDESGLGGGGGAKKKKNSKKEDESERMKG